MHDDLDPHHWDRAVDHLLADAADDLDAGGVPTASLHAYEGDDLLATVVLRPVDAGGSVQALIEVLALMLPLGTDRIAVCLPGRAWPADDPLPPVDAELDLRQPVLVIGTIDGTRQPARTTTSVHALHLDDHGWRWTDTLDAQVVDDEPVIDTARRLLEARGAIPRADDGDLRVAAQLGRVLLLGHLVALSPTAAERLRRQTITP